MVGDTASSPTRVTSWPIHIVRRDDGPDPDARPHFSTAESVNPPLPGDPRYDAYVTRRAEWMLSMDRGTLRHPPLRFSLPGKPPGFALGDI